jgi:hypothetical protein
METSPKPISHAGQPLVMESALDDGCGSMPSSVASASSPVPLPSGFVSSWQTSLYSRVSSSRTVSTRDHLSRATRFMNESRALPAAEKFSASDGYHVGEIHRKSKFFLIRRMSCRIFNQVLSLAFTSIQAFRKAVSPITAKSSTA